MAFRVESGNSRSSVGRDLSACSRRAWSGPARERRVRTAQAYRLARGSLISRYQVDDAGESESEHKLRFERDGPTSEELSHVKPSRLRGKSLGGCYPLSGNARVPRFLGSGPVSEELRSRWLTSPRSLIPPGSSRPPTISGWFSELSDTARGQGSTFGQYPAAVLGRRADDRKVPGIRHPASHSRGACSANHDAQGSQSRPSTHPAQGGPSASGGEHVPRRGRRRRAPRGSAWQAPAGRCARIQGDCRWLRRAIRPRGRMAGRALDRARREAPRTRAT